MNNKPVLGSHQADVFLFCILTMCLVLLSSSYLGNVENQLRGFKNCNSVSSPRIHTQSLTGYWQIYTPPLVHIALVTRQNSLSVIQLFLCLIIHSWHFFCQVPLSLQFGRCILCRVAASCCFSRLPLAELSYKFRPCVFHSPAPAAAPGHTLISFDVNSVDGCLVGITLTGELR